MYLQHIKQTQDIKRQIYNENIFFYREIKRQELEKKEQEWMEELERYMVHDSSSSTSNREKSHHGFHGWKGSGNKENKSRMISPTVTRKFSRSRKGIEGKDDGASTSHAIEKQEIQKTLAEAGKLLAMGAVEPLILSSPSCMAPSFKKESS